MLSGFSLLVGLGASLGLWQVARHVPSREAQRWVCYGLVVLAGCLLGARLLFVLLHATYYRHHLWEVFQPWLGGLSWSGTVGGGVLALVLLARRSRIPFAIVADHLAPLAAPLAITIWLGCWQAGCAYGTAAATGQWWGVPGRGEDGSYAARLPLQLVAAFALLFYFGWLERKLSRPHPAGWRASLTGLGLAGNLLLFSFLRADAAPGWLGLRLDVWVALFFLVAMLAGVWWIVKRDRRKHESNFGAGAD